MSRFRYMLVATVVLLMAMTAIALAGQRHTSSPRGPAPVPSAQAHAQTVARHRTARHTAFADTEQNTTDTDNVQQGDQTSPDTPSSGASEESTTQEEQSADTEQGQPGEPSGGGHQDPPGDVNHECSGNCQE